MDYKRFSNKLVIRLDKGDELVDNIKKVCVVEGVRLGIVSGLGATNRAIIGLFETATKEYHMKEYTGDMEITSLIGNVTTMDEEIYLHLHINLGDINNQIVGGHLTSAYISATGEIFIDIIEGVVEREFSHKSGLNLINFKK